MTQEEVNFIREHLRQITLAGMQVEAALQEALQQAAQSITAINVILQRYEGGQA